MSLTLGVVPPNSEIVTLSWLVLQARFPVASVATTLPARDAWASNRFLQVRALPAGSSNPDLPERRSSVLALDSWGATAKSSKPMWREAADQLEQVRAATFQATWGRPLAILLPGYAQARVLGVAMISEPARVENDPSGYARMTCNLAVDWTV